MGMINKKMKLVLIVIATGVILVFGCSSIKQNKSDNKASISGEFQSLRGVMHKYSCYCGNASKITDSSGKTHAVCIDDNIESIDCHKIKAMGYFKEIVREEMDNSPCPSGSLNVFVMTAYECIE